MHKLSEVHMPGMRKDLRERIEKISQLETEIEMLYHLKKELDAHMQNDVNDAIIGLEILYKGVTGKYYKAKGI